MKIELEKDSTCFQEVPGAKRLLKYLESNPDFEAGIATGGFQESAIFKLTKLGFDISNILISHSDNFKLKHDIIKELIDNMYKQRGISNSDKIFYIGDREYDYKTAQDLNIDFIGIDFKRDDKLKKLGINKVVNDFSSIENFFDLIN